MKQEPEKFEFKFTGKMTILIDLDGSGPMQFTIDDLDLTKSVVGMLIESDGFSPLEINSYDKDEEELLRKVMNVDFKLGGVPSE